MSEPLILASSSSARRQMLENAQVAFRMVPARIDEAAHRAVLSSHGTSPRDIADALADAKARQVSGRYPAAVVIGSDQVLEYGGEVLAKPADPSEARAQLQRLRGREHFLHSAAVIAREGRAVWRHVGTARLVMRDFSDSFLDDYLARVERSILTTVGCYQLEGYGVRLFSSVEGDYFTVLGMPLINVLGYLTQAGHIEK